MSRLKAITLLLYGFCGLYLFVAAVGCGKKQAVYQVELQRVGEYLPHLHKVKVDTVKNEYLLKKTAQVVLFPAVQLGTFVWEKSFARIYLHKYESGEENFNEMLGQQKYNFVIVNDHIAYTKTGKARLRDLYSKHARLSEFRKYVNFAGSIWKVGESQFFFNNHSGSYKPPGHDGYSAERLLNVNFPHLTFTFKSAF